MPSRHLAISASRPLARQVSAQRGYLAGKCATQQILRRISGAGNGDGVRSANFLFHFRLSECRGAKQCAVVLIQLASHYANIQREIHCFSMAAAVIMNDADTEEMRKCGVIRIGGRGGRTGDTGRERQRRSAKE